MADIARPTLEDPKDNWLVYADALQSAGDPRGELIVLNLAVEDGSSASDRDAHLARHAEAIYGSLAAHRDKLEIAWKWCVPVTLSLKIGPKDQPAKLIEALLGSPLAADMQTLRLVAQTPSEESLELGSGLALLPDRLPSSCTGLELIDERAQRSRILVSADYSPDQNLVDFGNLDSVWRIAHLRRLHLQVADMEQVELGKIDAPALEEFTFLGLRWSQPYGRASQMAEAFAAANWPKLRRLGLRIPETFTYSWPDQSGAYVRLDRYDEYNEDYGDDEGWAEDVDWSAELGGLLGRLANTPIEHLSLTSFASSRNLLQALAEHGLPATLRSLDLSASDLGSQDVAWMVEHTTLFDQLELLDLSDTLIDDPSPLSVLRPKIVHSSGGGAIYRFSVGME
jgi:hypothetical protein